MKPCKQRLLPFLLISLLQFFQPAFATEKLLVYAAASTSNAISEIINQFNQQDPAIQIKASYASSSILAKQIEAGAPADVFISANPAWMDYLQESKLINNESRFNLLSNTLVMVAPSGKVIAVEMNNKFNFAEKLEGKLCIGDPDHVPAGIYAKQALVSLGWWNKINTSIVGTKDVRAALTLVEQGECSAGIIYSTDASSSNKIDLIAAFPADSHSPIVYPVASLDSAPKSAHTFLNYLVTPHAKKIFTNHGFKTH